MRKILIVDDKKSNLDLAQQQLGGIPDVKLFFAPTFEAVKLCFEHVGPFDAVFTDVMMPAESRGINPKHKEIGKEIPYGLVIALMAVNAGIKAISLVTDSDHHDGPIPWSLDEIIGGSIVKINLSKNWKYAYESWFEGNESPHVTLEKNKTFIIGFSEENLSNPDKENFIFLPPEEDLISFLSSKIIDIKKIFIKGELCLSSNWDKQSNSMLEHFEKHILPFKLKEQKIIILSYFPKKYILKDYWKHIIYRKLYTSRKKKLELLEHYEPKIYDPSEYDHKT